MNIDRSMKTLGVQKIVFVPADDLVPYDSFHAWPFDWTSTEQIGRGSTIEDAINDMLLRNVREAA